MYPLFCSLKEALVKYGKTGSEEYQELDYRVDELGAKIQLYSIRQKALDSVVDAYKPVFSFHMKYLSMASKKRDSDKYHHHRACLSGLRRERILEHWNAYAKYTKSIPVDTPTSECIEVLQRLQVAEKLFGEATSLGLYIDITFEEIFNEKLLYKSILELKNLKSLLLVSADKTELVYVKRRLLMIDADLRMINRYFIRVGDDSTTKVECALRNQLFDLVKSDRALSSDERPKRSREKEKIEIRNLPPKKRWCREA